MSFVIIYTFIHSSDVCSFTYFIHLFICSSVVWSFTYSSIHLFIHCLFIYIQSSIHHLSSTSVHLLGPLCHLVPQHIRDSARQDDLAASLPGLQPPGLSGLAPRALQEAHPLPGQIRQLSAQCLRIGILCDLLSNYLGTLPLTICIFNFRFPNCLRESPRV